MSVTLILGGARSGKSKRAEILAQASSQEVVYLATSPLMHDAEWQQRVERHRLQRPSHWQTVEEPLLIADVLLQHQGCVLVDCLTLWLSNVMMAELDVDKQVLALCEGLHNTQAEVILVSNELGMGLVPETALGRQFRDEQGRLNQQVAALADKVEFMVAGLPWAMKGARES